MASNYRSTTAQQPCQKCLIIWLDKHIGDPDYCRTLKRAFSCNADPGAHVLIKWNELDVDHHIVTETRDSNVYEGTVVDLLAFSDIEKCLHCFRANQQRRIFFIVSGSYGRVIVPAIMKYCPHVFNYETPTPYDSILVFCRSMEENMDWASDYVEHVQMFTGENQLLARLLRDIAEHFLAQGNQLFALNTRVDTVRSYKHFKWARKLFGRANSVEQYNFVDRLTYTDTRMADAKRQKSLLPRIDSNGQTSSESDGAADDF